MDKTEIAVLMTCFNRKDSTLACLNKLRAQDRIDHISLSIYLVDDGCTDGTAVAVKKNFPDISILRGDGELYWGGGMRLAFGEALNKGYDFYLWLNDDAMLDPHAVRTMCETSRYLKDKNGKDSIIAGAMRDAKTGELTYGGSRKLKFWSPLSYSLVKPGAQPEQCDVVNGNLVLIPHNIARIIGNLSKDFTHQGGDYDYSLRAGAQGFFSWLAPGYMGTCSRNTLKGSVQDKALPLQARVDRLAKPTTLIPAREWMLFIRRHGGVFWPIYWLRTLVRRICPWLWVLLRTKKV